MIHAYTGKTGSGKTSNMVDDVYKEWLKGHDVYSNTMLRFQEISKSRKNVLITEKPQYFTFYEKFIFIIGYIIVSKLFKKNFLPFRRGNITYFTDLSEVVEARNGIITIDEGQYLFEARNWENLPDEFSNKLRQHRKHKLDLYTTTQNLGTIDINYRRLVQRWIHCKDLFAFLGLRNPNLLSFHFKEKKDIDYLFNNVDDLQVPTIKKNLFIISRWKRRKYDTLYDIGFHTYKSVWISENNKRLILIMPKKWALEKGRQHLLLTKFYYTLTN